MLQSTVETSLRTESVRIALDPFCLEGTLTVPEGAVGVVLFAQGGAGVGLQRRNEILSAEFHNARLGTLQVNVLTADEAQVDDADGRGHQDLELLAGRLVVTLDWLGRDPRGARLPIGLYGSTTGAAAALMAAAERPEVVRAVVCRAGRVDLATPAMGGVKAATLLIVGGDDGAAVDMNQQALSNLSNPDKWLSVVTDGSNLSDEPAALIEVGRLASTWFGEYLIA